MPEHELSNDDSIVLTGDDSFLHGHNSFSGRRTSFSEEHGGMSGGRLSFGGHNSMPSSSTLSRRRKRQSLKVVKKIAPDDSGLQRRRSSSIKRRESKASLSVQFVPTVDVFAIPHLNDLCEEEFQSIWMQEEDFQRIEDDNFRSVQLHEKKNKDVNVRGLEYHTSPSFAVRRDRAKRTVWSCILDQQSKQRDNLPKRGTRNLMDRHAVVEIRLSHKYKEVTAESALLAQIAALKDEKSAEQVHKEVTSQETNLLRHLEKMNKKKQRSNSFGRKKREVERKSESTPSHAMEPASPTASSPSSPPSSSSSVATNSTAPSSSSEADTSPSSSSKSEQVMIERSPTSAPAAVNPAIGSLSTPQQRRPPRFRLFRQPSFTTLLIDDKKPSSKRSMRRRSVVSFDRHVRVFGRSETLHAARTENVWYKKKEIKSMKSLRKLTVQLAVNKRLENAVVSPGGSDYEETDKFLLRGFETMIELQLGRKDYARESIRAVIDKQAFQRRRRERHKGEGNQFCHMDIEPEELARYYKSCTRAAVDEALQKAEKDADEVIRNMDKLKPTTRTHKVATKLGSFGVVLDSA